MIPLDALIPALTPLAAGLIDSQPVIASIAPFGVPMPVEPAQS